MLFVGLKMFADLAAKAQAINQSFMALKQAPDAQAAPAALQTLSAQLSRPASRFVSLVPSAFFATAHVVVPPTAPPNQNSGAPNNGVQTPPPIPNPVSDAAQKAKDALNKLIHF